MKLVCKINGYYFSACKEVDEQGVQCGNPVALHAPVLGQCIDCFFKEDEKRGHVMRKLATNHRATRGVRG